MRFAGIDVGSRTHVVAVVDEDGQVLAKPTPFGENAAGYQKLLSLLGPASDVLIALEATGHYGRNLLRFLGEGGFQTALLNPLRTHRFAQEDLSRAKTDSVDALGIARFAAQKRPTPTPLPDAVTEELRELVRMHDRLAQDLADRQRQLHRMVALGFPEFLRHVRTLTSRLATEVLLRYPTAQAIANAAPRDLAQLGSKRRKIGPARATALVEAAKVSVARHDVPVYRSHVVYICEEIHRLQGRLLELQSSIEAIVHEHPVASLLITIDGIAPITAAHIIAAVGDPARFRDGAALAAHVGVVPGTRQSGLWRPGHAPLCRIGNARLRKALWMPTLSAVHHNVWLRASYERARASGKPAKVALVACMRKLLTAVYSVAKNRKAFVPHVK